MKIIKISNDITVILQDGTTLYSSNCTDEMYQDILDNQENEELVTNIMLPSYSNKKKEALEAAEMISDLNKSEYISTEGSSIYIRSISQLSLPMDLAMAIWKAEKEEDLRLLSSYLNFWTLASLNPDSRARTNLFWFLDRYGMSISSSGLFVAYRNVILKKEGVDTDKKMAKFITDSFSHVRYTLKKGPKNYSIGLDSDGELLCTATVSKLVEVKGNLAEMYEGLSDEKTAPVYTDGYTKKFTIRIGEPVTMPREACDPEQDNTCSRGLHVAGKSWLSSNYFGDTGLKVLVNPADVVAVPPNDDYGKMRTCAYYPISIVDFDENGKLVDEPFDNGFEDNFIDMISYVGDLNTDDSNAYHINIPTIPELNRTQILDRIDNIKESLRIKNQYNEN